MSTSVLSQTVGGLPTTEAAPVRVIRKKILKRVLHGAVIFAGLVLAIVLCMAGGVLAWLRLPMDIREHIEARYNLGDRATELVHVGEGIYLTKHQLCVLIDLERDREKAGKPLELEATCFRSLGRKTVVARLVRSQVAKRRVRESHQTAVHRALTTIHMNPQYVLRHTGADVIRKPPPYDLVQN